MTYPPEVRFTIDEANRAYDAWGANCAPGAIAAILGLTLDQIRPHLGDFERKRYTNPKLMFDSLRYAPLTWPDFGLARV